MTLGTFWMGQQTQLNHLERSHRSLAWIHIVFLFFVSITPFSTRESRSAPGGAAGDQAPDRDRAITLRFGALLCIFSTYLSIAVISALAIELRNRTPVLRHFPHDSLQ